MVYPVLKYNASTGSDTAASGAGPATAITGTSAAHTGGAASTTITLTNSPDLSGVTVDVDVIWLNTTAGGRHLSRITAVDDGADTVTVEDSFNIGSGSAVNYAIGGKRQNPENDTTNMDWDDIKAGWVVELEAGTYTFSASNSFTDWQSGSDKEPVTIRSTDLLGTKPVIDIASLPAYGNLTFTGDLILRGIRVLNSGTEALDFVAGGADVEIIGCEFAHTGVSGGMTPPSARHHVNNLFDEVGELNVRASDSIINCTFRSSTADCMIVEAPAYNRGAVSIVGNLLYDGAASGITIEGYAGVNSSDFPALIKNNTIHGMVGDAIEFLDAWASPISFISITILDNAFTDNGGYGIRGVANMEDDNVIFVDNNLFNGNTSGTYLNGTLGPNDITSAPGYTDEGAGTEDFTPASGSALIDAGIPQEVGV